MLTPAVVLLSITTTAAFVVLYTVIGAAGTYATLDWPQRLALWGIAGVFCFPICYATAVLALYLWDSRPLGQLLFALTAVTAGLAISSTALIYTLDRVLWPEYPAHDLVALYVWVFPPMVLGSIFVSYLISRRQRQGHPVDRFPEAASEPRGRIPAAHPHEGSVAVAVPADPSQPDSPFFARLPAKLGRDLIYLKMNDHYVEAFTSAGRGIILMRFADAVTELGDAGMQVHRSSWVSFRHVVTLVRDRHRRFLELTGGHRVRVSRTHLPAVRLAIESLEAGIRSGPSARMSSKVSPDPIRIAATDDNPPQSLKPPPNAMPPQRQPPAQSVLPLSHFLPVGSGDSEPVSPAPRSR